MGCCWPPTENAQRFAVIQMMRFEDEDAGGYLWDSAESVWSASWEELPHLALIPLITDVLFHFGKIKFRIYGFLNVYNCMRNSLLQHGRIDLGSILVIAREKELWHNLGAQSQLIWPGWRRNSQGSSRPPFHLFPRSLHAICGGSDGPSCSQSLPFAKAWDIIRLLALFSPWWDLTAECCFCHICKFLM